MRKIFVLLVASFVSMTSMGQMKFSQLPVRVVGTGSYAVGVENVGGIWGNYLFRMPDTNSLSDRIDQKGTVSSVTAGTGLSGGTITGTGTISLPAVGTAGTYGGSSAIPVITTDAQGRVSSVSTATITPTDTSRFHHQGGNSYGDTARFGANDNNAVSLRANGVNHYIIGSTGIQYMIGDNTAVGNGGIVLDLANKDGSGNIQSSHLYGGIGRTADGIGNVAYWKFGSSAMISSQGLTGYSNMMLNNNNTSATAIKGANTSASGGNGLILVNVNYTAGPAVAPSSGTYSYVTTGDNSSGNAYVQPTSAANVTAYNVGMYVNQTTGTGVVSGYSDSRVTLASVNGKYAGLYLTQNSGTGIYGVYQAGTAANLFTGSTTFSAGVKVGNGSFTSEITTAATANRSVGLKDGDGTIAFTNDSTVFATTYGRDTASRNVRTYVQSTYIPLSAIGAGTATLLSGTVTVTDAACSPSSYVIVTLKSNSGTISFQYKVVPGSGSFVITGLTNLSATQTLDNSTLQYVIKY